jgi:WD40 repeat protein
MVVTPGPSRPTPDPRQLAARPAAADALSRADLPPDLVPDAPAELVAVLGKADGPTGQVNAVAVSPDGRHLAAAGPGGLVRLWDLGTRRLISKADRPEHVASCATFDPTGRCLAGWRDDGVIGLLDPSADEGWRKLAVHGPYLTALAVSPVGSTLASGGGAMRGVGAVRLWDLPAGHGPRLDLRREFAADSACVWCVAFSPDGRTVAVGGQQGLVRLFDVETGWSVEAFRQGGWVQWLGFHPNGQSIAATSILDGPNLVVWNLANRSEWTRVEGGQKTVVSGAWRADGLRLATVANATHGVVELWETLNMPPTILSVRKNLITYKIDSIEQQKMLTTEKSIKITANSVPHALAMTPEGRYVATANPDGTVSILRLAERLAGKP